MRSTLLLVLMVFLFAGGSAQVEYIPVEPEPMAVATATTRSIIVDLGNAEEVTLALRKIHTYKYLETLVLEGEGDVKDLRKIFYRIASHRNLNALVLSNNE